MKHIKRLLNALAKRFGYRIDSYDHLAKLMQSSGCDNWLERRSLLMQARDVDCVLDVGANVGQYARSLRVNGFKGQIISFEPLKSAFEKLRGAAQHDELWRCENYALGAVDSTALINVAGNSQSSSLLAMRKLHAEAAPESRYVGTEAISVRRLDGVFSELVGAHRAPYLKIDAQGYEKEVLKGGIASLPRISLVQIEASLCSLYEGDS